MSGELIPPAVIDILGNDASFKATIGEDTAILAKWADANTATTLSAEDGSLQATLATVKAELLDLARQVTNARLGADAAPFWAEIAALRATFDAMSPLDINVDANISAALAKIAALRGSLASAQTGSLLADALAAGSGGGGGGGAGLLAALGFGKSASGGIFGLGAGLAGFGTLGSLAGLGPESILTTLLGIGGSAAGGLAGGAALGLGSAGVAGVGIGTDLAGIGQAAGDVKQYTQNLAALNQAIALYGQGSTEAAAAQYALNQQIQYFSANELKAIQTASATATGFHAMFDQVTQDAETTGAEILTQLMQVGEKFLPTIGQYASQNMTIIQADLQPLLTWIQGPGLTIFRQLEQQFQNQLPAAMGAFDNGVEVLIRVLGFLAPYTGKLIDDLDRWMTELNGADFSRLTNGINSAITIFRDWEGLIKAVGDAIYELFTHDAGTGTAIVVTLTNMVNEFNNWVRTVQGGDSLHSLLESHKEEMLAIIGLLGQLIGIWGQLELAARPVLQDIVTGLATVVSFLLKIPGIGQLAGLVIAFEILGSHISPLNGLLGSFNNALKRLAADGLIALGTALTGLGGPFATVGGWLTGFGGKIDASMVDAAAVTQATQASIATSLAGIDASLAGGGAAFTGFAANAERSAAIVDLAASQMRGAVLLGGAAGAGAAGEGAAEGDAAGTATGLEGASAAGGTLAGLMGPITLGLGIAAASAFSLEKSFTATSTAANSTTTSITNMKPGTSISALQGQLAYLQQQINITKTSLANVPSPGFSIFSGLLGQANGQAAAYNHTLDLENTKLQTVSAALSAANANVGLLSKATGLSTPIVQSLAQALGINLNQALSPAAVETMTNYIKQQGGVATVTGQQWQASAQAIAAANELMAAKAATAMPTISAATSKMIAQVQPQLVGLVSDMQKSGNSSGAELVSAFLANLSPAELASKQMHDGMLSPLEPLVAELQEYGDNSAAQMISKFIGHQGAASTAAKSMHDAIVNPLAQLQGQLEVDGDTGAAGFVYSILKHQSDAGEAGHTLSTAVSGALVALSGQLQSTGNTAMAALIDEIVSHQGSAGAAALAIGGSISGAIYAGINGGIPQIISAAQAAVNDALAAAHHAISNPPYPSQVWREQIGQSMGAGIAAGLMDTAALVRSAAASLVSPSMIGVLHGAATGVAGSGAAYSPTYNVVINVGAGANGVQIGQSVRQVLQQHDDAILRSLRAGSISSAGG